MTTEQMKKLYESGDYVIVRKKGLDGNDYEFHTRIPDNDIFSENEIINILGYKLIHKDHEAIADAVINDNSVVIEQYVKIAKKWVSFLGSHIEHGFFNTYTHTATYRLKPQKQDKPTQINSMEDLNDIPIGEQTQIPASERW